MFMANGPIDQSGQGSAVERRLRHAAGPCSVARGNAALIARVRPVRTSSLPVPRGSDTSEPAGRSFRGYGADHTQAPGGNGTSSSCLCEEQWANYRSDRQTRVGPVSEDSEKAWVSPPKTTATPSVPLIFFLIPSPIQ